MKEKEKIKNKMKDMIKKVKLSKSQVILMIIFSAITVVLSLGTSYAAVTYLYDSKDVSYDNTRSGIVATDVQGAVDELYSAANDYSSMNTRVNGVEEIIGDSTLTTTDQTLTGGINEINEYISANAFIVELGQISDLNIASREINTVYHFTFLQGITNNPFSTNGGHGYLFVNESSNFGSQIIYTNGGIKARRLHGGSYGSWVNIATF